MTFQNFNSSLFKKKKKKFILNDMNDEKMNENKSSSSYIK